MLLAQLSASLHHCHEQSYSLLDIAKKSNPNNAQEAARAIKARHRNSASATLNFQTSLRPVLLDLNTQMLRARCHKLNQAATTLNHYPLAQLGTAPEDLHQHYLQKLAQLDHLHDGLDCYIPLDGQSSGMRILVHRNISLMARLKLCNKSSSHPMTNGSRPSAKTIPCAFGKQPVGHLLQKSV